MTPKRDTRRNKPQARNRARRDARPLPEETRGAEAITIAWMLTMISTIAAEFVAAICALVRALANNPNDLPTAVRLAPSLMLLIGVVTGALCLLLAPVVLWQRRTPPPRAITITALLVGASPLAIILVVWLAS